MRGYKSPLHETLLNSRMDKEMLDAMLTAMRKVCLSLESTIKEKGANG